MKRTKPGSGTDYMQFMHDRHHQTMIKKFMKPNTNNNASISQTAITETTLQSARLPKKKLTKNNDELSELITISNDAVVKAVAD